MPLGPVFVLLSSRDSDGEGVPLSLNRSALVILVLSGVVAFVGMFSLPALIDAGFTFRQAFGAVCAVEFVTALTGGYAGHTLYSQREIE